MIPIHEKYFTALAWILFIGLCGLSLFFMVDVPDKFIESKSSFSESEQAIKELPQVTLCFTKTELPRTYYEYGKDFEIIGLFILAECKTTMIGEVGPMLGKPCVFPFIYKGITYNECMDSAHHSTSCYWCSTKVDGNGVHINNQGHWGCCNEICPTEDEKGMLNVFNSKINNIKQFFI